MQSLRPLVDAGLVRRVGVSNYSVDQWRAAERALRSPVVANQVRFSLVSPGPAADLVPYAARQTGSSWRTRPSPRACWPVAAAPGTVRGMRARSRMFGPRGQQRLAPLTCRGARGCRCSRSDGCSGRAGVGAPPSQHGRDPGRSDGRAARGERRGRRSRAIRRRVHAPFGRGGGIGEPKPLIEASRLPSGETERTPQAGAAIVTRHRDKVVMLDPVFGPTQYFISFAVPEHLDYDHVAGRARTA